MFKIYKQLMQLNSRKTNQPTKQWAEDPRISKRDIQMANKHMERRTTDSLLEKCKSKQRAIPDTSQNGHHQKTYRQ